VLFAALLFLFIHQSASAFVLSVTTDIHAGKMKKRDYTKYRAGNIVYPSDFDDKVREWLSTPADIYLALGDNINTCKDSLKAKDLADIVKQSGKTVFFGFGNHDCDEGFKYLSNHKYYFYDKDNWRIIVLNSEEKKTDTFQNDGGFSEQQLDWLEYQLDTDKNIVLAVSKPAYQTDLVTKKQTWSRFFDIVKKHKNIKHVFGGDYHVFHETREYEDIPDVQFHYVQALSLRKKPNQLTQYIHRLSSKVSPVRTLQLSLSLD
jgi:hypothetical protein